MKKSCIKIVISLILVMSLISPIVFINPVMAVEATKTMPVSIEYSETVYYPSIDAIPGHYWVQQYLEGDNGVLYFYSGELSIRTMWPSGSGFTVIWAGTLNYSGRW